MEGVLLLLRGALALWHIPTQSVGLWSTLLAYGVAAVGLMLAVRWFRQRLMWPLRNQLIVTYLFIGAVPVVFVLAMAYTAGNWLTGRVASFLAISDLHARLERLEVIRDHGLPGGTGKAGGSEAIADSALPGAQLTTIPDSALPRWLSEHFSGLVEDDGQLYLRACNVTTRDGRRTAIVASVPVTRQLLNQIASGVGQLNLLSYEGSTGQETGPSLPGYTRSTNAAAASTSAGTLPAAQSFLDRTFEFNTVLEGTDWSTGESRKLRVLNGLTRPSIIYSRISASTTQWNEAMQVLLLSLVAAFTLIVLAALYIGIRLTRIITRSVANLYRATQHINRGDFAHRITVKESDQLAALQGAFNSMTESLEKLIAEQKDKERLQSELEIAQQVQEQLFPKPSFGIARLELYGICRPARIVSGDYYDFICYGEEQIGIAVGDISGKGISAALLMATIHSAVRAYEQEEAVLLEGTATAAGGRSMRVNPPVASASLPSPARILRLLNRHLYQSTPAEKYATLFLAVYDGDSRKLMYSNAGHVPPLVLTNDGRILRLDAGGTVVGLFDEVEYEEQSVVLGQGDIFVAYSDGVTEPENEFGEFGEDRLIRTILDYRHLPLERITEQVLMAVQDWIGSTEQPDDITLVLARISS